MSKDIVPKFGKKFDLSDYDPDDTPGLTKEQGQAAILGLRTRVNDLQNVLYADKRYALLVVLQGIDTAGKDSTINSVFQEAGPLGCSVVSFGVPTDLELSHDYLWRYHVQAPRRGHVTAFNRSHYESVLVERVKNIVPPSVWKKRYDEINAFESYLASQGTVILKFFLHISKDEQRERLQERVDNPKKHWKFNMGDLEERKHWDDYQAAYEDMIDHCHTEAAPWHVVPADHKWYRDVIIARAIVDRLESLDLRYPPGEEGIDGLVVE